MTRPRQYVLDDHGEPLPCDDLRVWGQWMQTADRRVAVTDLEAADAHVSTIFLGLDHGFREGPALLWETMVFGGLLDGAQERYTSREAAQRGHEAMCQRVTAALSREDR